VYTFRRDEFGPISRQRVFRYILTMDIVEGAALWSALAATAAAVIAYRVYRWQRQSDIPVVLCELWPPSNDESWWEMLITVRNCSSTRWKSESMRIKHPRQALGFSLSTSPHTENDYGERVPDYAAARAGAERVFAMAARTDPAGTPRNQYMSGGDTSYERVHLSLPSGANSLKLELKLVSMDSTPRKLVVPIVRELPTG